MPQSVEDQIKHSFDLMQRGLASGCDTDEQVMALSLIGLRIAEQLCLDVHRIAEAVKMQSAPPVIKRETPAWPESGALREYLARNADQVAATGRAA